MDLRKKSSHHEQMIFFNIGVKQSGKNSLLKNGARKLCNLPLCMRVCVRVCVYTYMHINGTLF